MISLFTVKGRRMTAVLAVAVLILLAMTGCTGAEIPSDMPPVTPPSGQNITKVPTAEPTAVPTPTPEPTPIVDLPADRIDKVQRTIAENGVEVVTRSSIEVSLNPFYCETEDDISVVDRTQLKLLAVDENGAAQAGIDLPCFAYSVEKGDSEGLPEGNWERYRISLKEGLVFADGTPITAEDVMFSLYTLADVGYDGVFDLGGLDIYGMRAYSTQIPESVRAAADKAIAAGITEEGTCPEGTEDTEVWEELWGGFDEAGIRFTQTIIDESIRKYCKDAYVQTFLSPYLTAAHVEAKDSLKVLLAMRLSGFVRSFNYSKNTMRDCFDVVHELDTEEMTVELFWEMIKQYYNWDLSLENGINYERPSGGKLIEDYLFDVYCEKYLGVESIEGITLSEMTFEDGAVRPCLDVIIGKNEDISGLNFYVAEKAVYESDPARTDVLTGAGEYYREPGYPLGVMLTANPNYLLGEPAQLYIRYEYEEPAEEEPQQ